MGVSESMAIGTLIGFSIDYVVHYASEYAHSNELLRADKMREAYRHMGVSIFAGFVTTFGSGFILLFTVFMTMQKFGSTVCQTVAFSFFVSTFLFGAFMHALGP